jgi:hypothetical protein
LLNRENNWKGVMMSKFKITIEKEGKKETLELDERLHH